MFTIKLLNGFEYEPVKQLLDSLGLQIEKEVWTHKISGWYLYNQPNKDIWDEPLDAYKVEIYLSHLSPTDWKYIKWILQQRWDSRKKLEDCLGVTK